MKTKYFLFNRQKVLISLLHELDGKVSNLDFQKLLFLYCQEVETKPSYEFIPYHFGAFSFTSYADRRKLMERDLLVDNDDSWDLTNVGQRIATELSPQLAEVAGFVRRYSHLRGNALIAETYRRYPYFGIRSQIAKKLLRGDEHALENIRKVRPAKSKPGLATIGYEGRTLEVYLNLLLEDGVTLLIDVRRNALSRKYGFSKSTLSKGSEGIGVRYKHLPELGIDSSLRKNLSTQESFDHLFDQYEREVLPQQTDALKAIAGWVEHGERVALTCFEHQSSQCHRHCVAEALESRLGSQYNVRHL